MKYRNLKFRNSDFKKTDDHFCLWTETIHTSILVISEVIFKRLSIEFVSSKWRIQDGGRVLPFIIRVLLVLVKKINETCSQISNDW